MDLNLLKNEKMYKEFLVIVVSEKKKRQTIIEGVKKLLKNGLMEIFLI